MLTVFVKTGCPYCAMVLKKLNDLGVEYEEKNIKDPDVVKELLEEGGKRQVPFLEDDNMTPYLYDDDVEMYESEKIVAYLDKKFCSKEGVKKEGNLNAGLHVERGGETCEACE